MSEVLLVMFALFLAYLYIPRAWFSRLWPAKEAPIQAVDGSCRATKRYVPEDAVLRRHFISHLRNEIEASLHPRPSDSILQRHYDALVSMTLEQRLSDLGNLQPC